MKRILTIIFLLFSIFDFHFSTINFVSAQPRQLFLVHTSDTHSCVEPISPNFSDSTQANKGGFIRRIALFRQLREQNPGRMLTLDCGDFSQGSVYYNLFKGEVEVKLMNLMHYDAVTIGNHEFDFGLENMARIFRMATFPIVCCNYDFTGTPCEGLVKPYVVVERNGVKVGILGVCPQPKGLIVGHNYEGIKFTSPALAAQPIINKLRTEEKCDVVVCLSHLGWGNEPEQDKDFIAHTSGIDVLLGGHTHTYFTQPEYVADKKGHQVVVDHTGKNARFIGTIELEVE
ncbi:MAG: metallophosphatase [Bacteroidaceae bacterium]|nr:metallophosphatase [Bacteroidaceae bacterium]